MSSSPNDNEIEEENAEQLDDKDKDNNNNTDKDNDTDNVVNDNLPKEIPAYETEEEEANYLRFVMELEFIQCLSNPRYLNFLAQNRYFQDKAFVNYLAYLQYWKEPQYAKFLVYPQSLYFLDLLQEERFRQELNHSPSTDFIHEQQYFHWQYYRNNRMAVKQQEEQQQQEGEVGQVDIQQPQPPQPQTTV